MANPRPIYSHKTDAGPMLRLSSSSLGVEATYTVGRSSCRCRPTRSRNRCFRSAPSRCPDDPGHDGRREQPCEVEVESDGDRLAHPLVQAAVAVGVSPSAHEPPGSLRRHSPERPDATEREVREIVEEAYLDGRYAGERTLLAVRQERTDRSALSANSASPKGICTSSILLVLLQGSEPPERPVVGVVLQVAREKPVRHTFRSTLGVHRGTLVPVGPIPVHEPRDVGYGQLEGRRITSALSS